MKLNKIALYSAIGLSLGGLMINSNSFKYYGVPPVGKDTFIYAIVQYVCFIFGSGDNSNAINLLSETIKSETQNATAQDYSKEYGEGLGQFDKSSFQDVISRTSQKNKDKIKKYFLIDLNSAKYEDLRKNPILSVILIRLKYWLVPYAIPSSIEDRYRYYKKYYNSIYGKATYSHYLASNGYVNV